jgi:hypothetical protein
VFVIALMLLLSVVKNNRDRIVAALSDMGWWFTGRPEASAGD